MDLVEVEIGQLKILEEFLPKLMEASEVESFVNQKYKVFEPKDTTKKGMFMSSIMKDLKGKADGSVVKEAVDKLFI